MQQAFAGIDLSPVVPIWLIVALAVVAVLALVPAFWRRARGAPLRALVFALILLALANPRLVEETRETRPDIALLVVDRSDSARIGTRAAQVEAARTALEARLGRLPELEVRTVEVPEGGNQGTRLFAAMEQALAEIPRARLAGVIALTDGQVHDVPAASPSRRPSTPCCRASRARSTGASGSSRRRASASSAAASNCGSRWTTSACRTRQARRGFPSAATARRPASRASRSTASTASRSPSSAAARPWSSLPPRRGRARCRSSTTAPSSPSPACATGCGCCS
ncbi:hypothetical protein [Dankookia sp. P2]|uniref:hypothetical protein n=1 Tax=Dankookia sp. P2 TaxID=3423955 RepID=UPI003D66C529